eukprot:c11770_g5_i1.p1 GENE.c11770_g5_i1~~c11770_g5_i1.p1  ORF type:complete len:404 (-),score=137.48 c11770_g5_i1:106-1266(-)
MKVACVVVLLVCCGFVLASFATPFDTSTTSSSTALTEQNAISNQDMDWERDIGDEVNKLMQGPLSKANPNTHATENDKLQANVQTTWAVASDQKATSDQERSRPPAMDGSIANLRGVLDRLEMENVNAAAVHEAQTATYASKRAQLQSLLAMPQQAVIQRLQESQLCEKHTKALGELSGMLSSSLERVQQLVQVRREQATHYAQITTAAKELTEQNKAALTKIQQLVEGEVASEQTLNGGYHFDPIALRPQQPEDVLRSVQNLASNLGALMTEKLTHADAAVSSITETFACPKCEQKTEELKTIVERVSGELDDARKECARLAATHREIDEADRERVISLKKDLEDLEAAERVHKAATAALHQQRENSQAVAKKMIGFFDSVASRT